MAIFRNAALVAVMASVVKADSSVISIFFPGADELPYVGSVIGSANGQQTLAISCGPGVDDNTCGFPSSVTVIAGPSTAYVSVSNQDATFIYDCKISASTKAVCAETFNGDFAYIATSTGTATTLGSTSSVVTETLGSTDIKWMPITITAPGDKAATKTATATGVAASSAADADWSNLSDSSTASTSTSTSSSGSGSSSTSTPVSATSSQTTNTATTATTAAATTATNAATTSSVSVLTWTGAAAKAGSVGSVAAGLLALAGMMW